MAGATTSWEDGRPGLKREAAGAERALRAFSRARGLAAHARRAGEHELAGDIEALAWDLVGEADPVRLSIARAHLGISDPTARDWTARGILQLNGRGPVRVTLESVARAAEHSRRLRAGGEADLAVALERHIYFDESMRSAELQSQLTRLRAARATGASGHRTAELASLALHRRIAERLDDVGIQAARNRVRRWLRAGGPVSREHARRWEELLVLPLPQLRRELVQDTEQMRNLRQDTPFAGLLTDRERADAILEARR